MQAAPLRGATARGFAPSRSAGSLRARGREGTVSPVPSAPFAGVPEQRGKDRAVAPRSGAKIIPTQSVGTRSAQVTNTFSRYQSFCLVVYAPESFCFAKQSLAGRHYQAEALVTRQKAEYCAAGVREYYILHRDKRYLAFYTLNPQGVYVPVKPVRGIIRSRVLPGFQFRIRDLRQQPDYAALIAEPVYQGFVMPDWQADIRARETAEKLLEEI